GVTVEELSQFFALAHSTLRQHLTILAKEGLIIEESIREGVGRPRKVYRLTPKAEELFPKRYAELLQRILQILAKEDRRAVDRILKKILEETVAENQHLASISNPRKRLEAVIQVLIDLGSVWELNEQDQSFLLKIYDCPFSKIVHEFPQVCGLAQSLLAQLTGASIQLTDWVVKGSPYCTFQVSGLLPVGSISKSG
ncbi:MAG: helix-turn-helix transcriptional regulator, partial [Nitrospira sp.]|nr:helix-turn-helix transcriptional regulator [Nitrospira sp.]